MPATDGLSGVVPLYNGARFLGETLDSLAAQTIPPGEVVVVDDGSSDDGADIARRHPVGARVISQPNAGIAVTRNHGAFLARSRYITFLDQDDLWLPQRHERILAYLAENPICRALTTTERRFYLAEDHARLLAVNEQQHKYAERIPDTAALADICASAEHVPGAPAVARIVDTRELLLGTIGVTCSNVFERELFLIAGGCVLVARTMDDYLGLLNVSRLTSVPLLDEPSVLYRIHPDSTTISAQWPMPFLTAIAAARYGGMLVPPGHARDPAYVSLGLFWRHWLLELARTDRDGLIDAIAMTRVLASSDERWILQALRLLKTGVRAKLRRLGLGMR